MSRTKIEWATHTWNPVTGCTKVSEGCRNCYAERQVQRFGARVHGLHRLPEFKADVDRICTPPKFTHVICHHDKLYEPMHWRKPRRVFVCSMSDLFHQDVPDEFIRAVFTTMASARSHIFMVLTKRPDRMLALLSRWDSDGLTLREGHGVALPNVIGMVSIEDQETADLRVPLLLQSPFAVRGVSYEPALGPVDLASNAGGTLWIGGQRGHDGMHSHHGRSGQVCHGVHHDVDPKVRHHHHDDRCERGLDWVICGGESGPCARPMHPDWARSMRDQCQAAGVPFFFKQWGEWKPIGQMASLEHDSLYRSRVKAIAGVTQDTLDEYYGRRCTVDTGVIHADGSFHEIVAPGSFQDGTSPMQTFKVGKKAAGRDLDGKVWDQVPELMP